MEKDNQPVPKQRDSFDADRAEELVRNNIGWMLTLAQRLLGERALAEDAVQEAFISAFRGLDEFENRSSLKTWLHRITVNAALTRLRKLKRLSEQPFDELAPDFDQYGCRIERPTAEPRSVDEILDSAQLRAQVHACIGKLPEAYRTVLLLRDIEGYDTREVAGLLDISDSNVKVRLHRARAALKKLIEPVLRGEELP